MLPEQRDAAYLWDMLTAARSILAFTEGVRAERFAEDRMLQRAVERELEIIGEAANRVSSEYCAEHPEVPWRTIVAQRNFLIHDYGGVDHERVWNVVTDHLPQLVERLELLVPPERRD